MKKLFFALCAIVSIIPFAMGKLSATKFPGTINDVSFKSRMENLTDGYKPFLDKKAYQELDISPDEEIYTDHMIATEESKAEEQENDVKKMNIAEYCEKYPSDTEKCSQTPVTQDTKPTTSPVISTPSAGYAGYTIGRGPVVENNVVTKGSCYPADSDRHFPNKILTTGKYENIHPAFEKALITVFRKEGGCGTIKNDPCGYTCYGIGSSPRCSGIVVKSRAEAEDVYYKNYWSKYKIYNLPDVISTDIFLASMASGPGTALSQFRVFLGLPKSTASVDSAMIQAVNNYRGDIHNDWMNKRDAFLQQVAQKRYHGSVSKGYKNAIELKRKNGCHVRPQNPLTR